MFSCNFNKKLSNLKLPWFPSNHNLTTEHNPPLVWLNSSLSLTDERVKLTDFLLSKNSEKFRESTLVLSSHELCFSSKLLNFYLFFFSRITYKFSLCYINSCLLSANLHRGKGFPSLPSHFFCLGRLRERELSLKSFTFHITNKDGAQEKSFEILKQLEMFPRFLPVLFKKCSSSSNVSWIGVANEEVLRFCSLHVFVLNSIASGMKVHLWV